MPGDKPASGRALPIGLMVVGSEMASFTILGLLLDLGFDTMPGCTIGFTLLGLAVAFLHLVKMSQALTRKKLEPPAPPTGGES